ncbi:MAG: response regulator transcription factor [Candidatus Thorarchaeota archaeon]
MTIKLLIVDNEASVSEVLQIYLSNQLTDFKIISAANGEEALLTVEKMSAEGNLPDITLMDLKMPVMNGIEATRKLAGLGVENIYILTGYLDSDLVAEASNAGAKGLLMKSEGYKAIADKLANFIRGM